MTTQEKEIYKKSLELFNSVCAICENNQVALHHIRYGACGRKTYMGNIIPLCPYHHKLVHSNKKKYQPILIKLIDEKFKNNHTNYF